MRLRLLVWWLSISGYALCAPSLQAQTAGGFDYNKTLYLFLAPGVVASTELGPSVPIASYGSFQIGGAAEGVVFKGLAVGAELAVSPQTIESKPVSYTFRTFEGRDVTAIHKAGGIDGWGSLNLSYHFKGWLADGRLVPFVTAGGTILARDGLTEATNYGGGISLWRSRHRGWRLEYRKHVIGDGDSNARLRSVRIGLVLR